MADLSCIANFYIYEICMEIVDSLPVVYRYDILTLCFSAVYLPGGNLSTKGDKEMSELEPDVALDTLISKSIDYIYTDGGEKTVDPKKEKPEELRKWLEELDVSTHNRILEFFGNLPHLSYEIKYTNKLGSERTITLTTLNDFFQFA